MEVAAAPAPVASAAGGSNFAFLRAAAVVVDFSRGRRGARAGFSGFSFSLVSFAFSFLVVFVSGVLVVLLAVSSSFFRRDRRVVEARRVFSPSALESVSTGGASSLGTPVPEGSVDIVVANDELVCIQW